MALATLSIDLVAQLATLQSGLDKAGRMIEKNAAQMEGRYAKLSSAAVAIGATFAGVLSVGALSSFFQRTVDGLDALNDLADATGASIENLSALEDVALRTGTSMDTVGGAVVKLNKVLGDAKPGSDQANVLRSIGLSAEDLRRMDPAEALRQVAVALDGYADDGNKARLVQELFGKSIREVAPLLKDLAGIGKLVATTTTEQAKEAEKFNNQLRELDKNASDAARRMTSELLPALNKLLTGFNTKGLVGVGDQIGEMIGLGKEYYALRTLNILADDLKLLEGQVSTAPVGPGGRVLRAQLKEKTAEYEVARDAYLKLRGLDKTPAEFRASQNYGDPYKPSAPGMPGAGAAKGGRSAAKKAYEGLAIDPLTLAALKRLEDSDTNKIAGLRLELQALIELRAEQGGGSVDEAILKVEEELGRLDPMQVAAAKSRERLNELLAATPTGQLSLVLADIELINAEFAAGKIPVELWAQAVVATTARLPQDTAKALDAMSEFTLEFQRNVQDTLGTTIRQTLAGDFSHIEQLWGDMLLNMASQAIAADIGNFLLGDKAKGGSNTGWLGSLFGFANGGVFAGGQVTKFADGGILNSATPFTFGGRMGVAGEAGPEGVLPLRRGRDGRLGVTAQGVGGVTNVYHIAAGVNRGELMAAMQMAAQTAESNVYRRLQSQRVMA